MANDSGRIQFIDYKKTEEKLKPELIAGLKKTPKVISPKFFYDREGSGIFDAITESPDYYLTNMEISIIRDHLDEICGIIGGNSALIEYGGANLKKINLILNHCKNIECYVPIDISTLYMQSSMNELLDNHVNLRIIAISADFTKPLKMPDIEKYSRRTVLFLGSSIGNFEPLEIKQFLENAYQTIREGDCMIVGVDLRKDEETLNRAYNDTEGITAAFNLNLISRINKEFGCNLDKKKFEHVAFYNNKEGRIEMHLRVLSDMDVEISGEMISFHKGELIHTENSYKFSPEIFSHIVEESGFKVKNIWMDSRKFYSIFVLIK